MSYRYSKDTREEYAGKSKREVHGMVSVRELAEHTGQRAEAAGREALDGTSEDDEIEVFGQAGVAARPSENAAVESLVLLVGASGDHAAVAAQIDSTRATVIDATGLEPDETIVYTSQSVVHIKADGTVEIRSLAGTAVALVPLPVLQDLRDWIADHRHEYINGAGAATPTTKPISTTAASPLPPTTPLDAPPTPTGTTILKAE